MSRRELWGGAVEAVAVLDALMALAGAAAAADGVMCRPSVVEPEEETGEGGCSGRGGTSFLLEETKEERAGEHVGLRAGRGRGWKEGGRQKLRWQGSYCILFIKGRGHV